MMVQRYDMNVDLPEDYLLAYARMVIWFGRLEGSIKLAIKNLAVSLKISTSFMEGLREAEMRRNFGTMCDYVLELHRRKYGDSQPGRELADFIEHLKKLADHRNHFVHGQWTIDQGKVIVLHSKWTKKVGLRSTRHVVPIETLTTLSEMIMNAWLTVQRVREEWAN
jgi:hypothetical protein